MSSQAVAPHPRIRRRRQAVVMARRRKRTRNLALLLALVSLGWLLFFSPFLAIEEVELEAPRAVAPAVSRELAAIAGSNLLRLDVVGLEERVEGIPGVRAAVVRRVLPGTLRLEVKGRRPQLALLVGEEKWALDRKGAVLGRSEGDLPLLAGVRAGPLAPGTVVSRPEVEAALEAWQALPPGIRARVKALLAPSPERISLVLDSDTVVRYGVPEQTGLKNRILSSLLAAGKLTGRGYVDVRSPGMVTVAEAD